jgi:hypothetical protein
MKHYLLLFLTVITFVSCNDDDDDYNEHEYDLEWVAAISTDLPSEFVYGRTYRIEIKIEFPNSCYFNYNQFDYLYEGTTRIIYPIAHVDAGIACTPNIRESTISIPVQALQTEPYIFKIYIGKDADDQDMFEEFIVPVI